MFSSAEGTRARVEKVAESLEHRGPDGLGYFGQGPWQLGMCRLAIQDRVRGKQPMESADGRIQVFCNGEIYNFRDVREELSKLGYGFYSECDTEIIAHAWLEWGESMLERFEGMFAIALYDAVDGSVFLARDRCGQKPLYYAEGEQEFVYASEVKGLLASGVKTKPHREQLVSYLQLRYVSEPQTYFKGVQLLEAGTYLKVSNTGRVVAKKKWWEVAEQPLFEGGVEDAVDELDSLVRASVEATLQRNQRMGLYLSSGVDSALLAHYVRELGGEVDAISVGFANGVDETQQAAELAKQYGFRHHVVHCSASDLESLPRVIRQVECPVGDTLLLAFDKLAEAASDIGCKIILGGEGADELFAGYSFQRAALRAEKLGHCGRMLASQAMRLIPARAFGKVDGLAAKLGATGRDKVAEYLASYSKLSESKRSVGLRTLWTEAELQDVLLGAVPAVPDNESLGRSLGVLNRQLERQFESWLQDWAIIRQERNTMAYGMEYRMPFLERGLIDFAFSLPERWKIRGNCDKWIWRKLAERKLPKLRARQAKQAFYYPVEAYSDSPEWQNMERDCLSQVSVERRGIFNYEEVMKVRKLANEGEFLPLKKVASLIMLELWYREFVDKSC